MKIGCILVQNGAFQKGFITMSNKWKIKNMEKIEVVKKKSGELYTKINE